MVELNSKPNSLLANFELLRGVLAASGPESLAKQREWAMSEFMEAGVPTTRDEEFKYLPLHDLATTMYGPALAANVERAESESAILGKIDAISLVFVNGEFAPELSTVLTLPDGVIVASIRETLEDSDIDARFGTVAKLKDRLGSTNDERFTALNTANFADGAYIRLAAGAEFVWTVHVQYLTTTDTPMAVYPRTLIIAEANTHVKVVESFSGLKGDAFVCPVTEVWVGQNASVEHVRVQNELPNSIHIGNLAVHQEADSIYTSTNVQFGGKIGRLDLNCWSNGEHTETWLNGTYIGRNEQILDNHTRIDHAQPNCQSFEVYKGIFDDRATGVFNGKIFVYQDAQKTDAKQTNQAILLSPKATINTKPQLEIFADDVKCTHGATVGRLSEEAMFYLRARGIPKKEAEGILVYAFAAESLARITQSDVKEALEAAIFAKLSA